MFWCCCEKTTGVISLPRAFNRFWSGTGSYDPPGPTATGQFVGVEFLAGFVGSGTEKNYKSAIMVFSDPGLSLLDGKTIISAKVQFTFAETIISTFAYPDVVTWRSRVTGVQGSFDIVTSWPTTRAEAEALPLTTASVNWNKTDVQPQAYETPEIKTVIQEIIDNATWTPAKGIGLMHLNNSSDVTSQSPHLNALFLNLFQAATASDFGPNLGKIKLIVEI